MARAPRFLMDRCGSVDLEHSTGNVLMMTRIAALEDSSGYGLHSGVELRRLRGLS